jgi:hypothetical protein
VVLGGHDLRVPEPLADLGQRVALLREQRSSPLAQPVWGEVRRPGRLEARVIAVRRFAPTKPGKSCASRSRSSSGGSRGSSASNSTSWSASQTGFSFFATEARRAPALARAAAARLEPYAESDHRGDRGVHRQRRQRSTRALRSTRDPAHRYPGRQTHPGLGAPGGMLLRHRDGRNLRHARQVDRRGQVVTPE